jgi:hypothetical protein
MNIIDNALGINTFNFLRGNITSPEMAWHFVRHTAIELEVPSESDFSFTRTVYDCDFFDRVPTDSLFVVCYNALLSCLDRAGVELDELYRIRLNMYTRQGQQYTHPPHVDDHQRQMNIGILYLTTNVGSPTILYKNRFNYGVDTNTYEDLKNRTFEPDCRVDSIANRFLMFNSSVYHSSTIPTQEAVRININYNFLLK